MNNDKIHRFLINQLDKAKDFAMLADEEDDSYLLYNQYLISKESDIVTVTMNVNSLMKFFHSMSIAVTWCTFHKNNKFAECGRIEIVDMLLYGIESTIDNYQKMIKQTKLADNKDLYIIKMSDQIYKRQKYKAELKKYVGIAKYWQLNKFIQKERNSATYDK